MKLEEIEKLRQEINKIDTQLIMFLEKRINVSKKIGKIKKLNKLDITDQKREEELINKVMQNTNLDKEFVEQLYGLIFQRSKNAQV